MPELLLVLVRPAADSEMGRIAAMLSSLGGRTKQLFPPRVAIAEGEAEQSDDERGLVEPTDLVAAFAALPDNQKQIVKSQISGLPIPSRNFLGIVWIILMITLAVVVLGGGWLVYQLVNDGKDSEVLVGFVSAALGALIGLLAPSPATGGS
jgi:hypothetical protein